MERIVVRTTIQLSADDENFCLLVEVVSLHELLSNLPDNGVLVVAQKAVLVDVLNGKPSIGMINEVVVVVAQVVEVVKQCLKLILVNLAVLGPVFISQLKVQTTIGISKCLPI